MISKVFFSPHIQQVKGVGRFLLGGAQHLPEGGAREGLLASTEESIQNLNHPVP